VTSGIESEPTDRLLRRLGYGRTGELLDGDNQVKAAFLLTAALAVCAVSLSSEPWALEPSIEVFRTATFTPTDEIIVCSDEPAAHIEQIERFSEAVFGRRYRILDGRKAVAGPPEAKTLVYLGHPESISLAEDCLRNYPKLLNFLEQQILEYRNTNALSTGIPDSTGSRLELFVGLCFLEGQLCGQDYYPVVFGLDPSICSFYDVCFSRVRK
jgi:hypothetical protein